MRQTKYMAALAALMLVAGFAAADQQWSQVSWYTAVSVAHSISYGVYNSTLACSQTALYYVEPAPINGVANKLNASTDSAGTYACQNFTQGAIKVNNDGSVGINVSAEFNQITTGVRMKIAKGPDGYQSTCDGVCNATSCTLTADCIQVTTGPAQVAYNIAQNTSQEYWLYADFNGVAGTAAPTKGNMTTTAVQSGA